MKFFTRSPQDTFSLGKKIASHLLNNGLGGSVVAFRGELGSGKTCLAKGIAFGLGVKENITSPTYTIINEYPLCKREERKEKREKTISEGLSLYHIDAYRLDNEEDFERIGGSQVVFGSGVSLIEWSERISNVLPKDAVTINIEITGPESRIIKIDGLDGMESV